MQSHPTAKIHPRECRDLTNHLVIMGFEQFPVGRAAAFASLD